MSVAQITSDYENGIELSEIAPTRVCLGGRQSVANGPGHAVRTVVPRIVADETLFDWFVLDLFDIDVGRAAGDDFPEDSDNEQGNQDFDCT